VTCADEGSGWRRRPNLGSGRRRDRAGRAQPVESLHRSIRSHTPIAEGLLWGNMATAATRALRDIRDAAPRA
jgi:hypothetical protein